MTKNPAEIAGTRYKNEKLMSRVQKTDGTSRCFAQIENIKRQSLNIARHILDIVNVDLNIDLRQIFRVLQRPPVAAVGY